jgi:hypothetical protein
MADAPLRILIADDSRADVELIRLYLGEGLPDRPLCVEETRSSAGALERAAQGGYDLILLDYRLDRLDGISVLRAARARGIDTPIILLTGQGDERVAVEAMKAGAADYLAKDGLTAAALGASARKALDRREKETQLRGAREALGASEARYRMLMEQASDGIFVADEAGRFVDVNSRACEMMGCAREELLTMDVAATYPPEDRDQALRKIQSMRAGRMVLYERRMLRKDGRILPVEVSARYTQGVGYQAIVRDLTERHALEQQFRQAQKMEAVGRLAAGVAHDFNNLLTAILGYSELLLGGLGPGDPRRAGVEEIRRAAERAGSLTRQLLAFSRQQVLQPRTLDLNEVVSGLHSMLRRLIGEDIDLRTTAAPDLGRVLADPGQIEQVIMNLAVNARDAMPRGGKLTIETANVALDAIYARTHEVVKPGPYVLLAVSDTGTGMDADVRSHLFEPFFTTKAKGHGTGLGLATVYGIVKQSGGYIWVYSEPGQGTAFKIYLPRAEGKAAGRSAAERPAEAPGGSETILLVEDEDVVRSLAREILEAYGYTVLEATRGEEALEASARHRGPIDLLLTDVIMPGGSGREAAERLAPGRPGMKVLYMSGYTNDAIVHHGVLAPGVAFLQKPFSPQALARKVREVLDAGPKAGARPARRRGAQG